MAAFQAKDVPLRIVSSPDKADYTLDSTIFHMQEAIVVKSAAMAGHASEAAMKLTDKSGEVVWAYAVTKGIMSRGSQSVAEACAKHFKELISKER
jgi:maleate cis-trans isomerase